MIDLFDKAPLWEKWRPTTLEGGSSNYDLGLVLDESIIEKLKEYKSKKNIPHILMAGGSGIGKTSLAKIICNDILGTYDVLEINASDETGIDFIRNKVKSFVTGQSFDGGLKVVILGESDGLSDPAMRCLNEIIEDYGESTRFIFTTNNVNKISQAIKSRCVNFEVRFSYKQYVTRVVKILVEEGYKIDKSVLENTITPLLKSTFPDFRKAFNLIENNSVDGVIKTLDGNGNFVKELWGMVVDTKVSPEDVREFYLNGYNEFSGQYYTLLRDLVLNSFGHEDRSFSRKFVTSANQAFRSLGHIDPEINVYQVVIDVKTSNKPL